MWCNIIELVETLRSADVCSKSNCLLLMPCTFCKRRSKVSSFAARSLYTSSHSHAPEPCKSVPSFSQRFAEGQLWTIHVTGEEDHLGALAFTRLLSQAGGTSFAFRLWLRKIDTMWGRGPSPKDKS